MICIAYFYFKIYQILKAYLWLGNKILLEIKYKLHVKLLETILATLRTPN